LEQAGFRHEAVIEIDPFACETLRINRPRWNVIETDVRTFSGAPYERVDLLAGGVPCPPFSIAGKQLGKKDERDLFPEMIRLAAECRPRSVMIENVRGLLDDRFSEYRSWVASEFATLGYEVSWRLLNASDYGVPQLRPRVVMVALQPKDALRFTWPDPDDERPPTVGEALVEHMASAGWKGARAWAKRANAIAPTLVGGSRLHGGPDLGPTRARKAWAELGVDGKTLAEEPPGPGLDGMPRLTVQMAAILQGFPFDWTFHGRKTQAYRQVGNAFPPPVARAVGLQLAEALKPCVAAAEA
jgi:DNA (cytosine-5)-methyltransferase 1